MGPKRSEEKKRARDLRWKKTGKYRSMAENRKVKSWENMPNQQVGNPYFNSSMNMGNGRMSNGLSQVTDADLLRQFKMMGRMNNQNPSNHIPSNANSSLLGPVPVPSRYDRMGRMNNQNASNHMPSSSNSSLLGPFPSQYDMMGRMNNQNASNHPSSTTNSSLLGPVPSQFDMMGMMNNQNVNSHISSSSNSSLLGPAPVPSLFDMSMSNGGRIDHQGGGNSWAQPPNSDYYNNLHMGGNTFQNQQENPGRKKGKKNKKGQNSLLNFDGNCVGNMAGPWANNFMSGPNMSGPNMSGPNMSGPNMSGPNSNMYNQNMLDQQVGSSNQGGSFMNRENFGGMSNCGGQGTDANLSQQYGLMGGMNNQNMSNNVSSPWVSLLGPAPIPSLFDVDLSSNEGIDYLGGGDTWTKPRSSKFYRNLFFGGISNNGQTEHPNHRKGKQGEMGNQM